MDGRVRPFVEWHQASGAFVADVTDPSAWSDPLGSGESHPEQAEEHPVCLGMVVVPVFHPGYIKTRKGLAIMDVIPYAFRKEYLPRLEPAHLVFDIFPCLKGYEFPGRYVGCGYAVSASQGEQTDDIRILFRIFRGVGAGGDRRLRDQQRRDGVVRDVRELDAVRRGVPTLFITVPDLLDSLRFAFSDPQTTFEARFEDIRNADLLVMDDFGTQNATPWAQEKLFQIINYRYINKLPTVITTNLILDEIESRIRSRLQDADFVKYIRITAPDYRRPTETSNPGISMLSMPDIQKMTFGNFETRDEEVGKVLRTPIERPISVEDVKSSRAPAEAKDREQSCGLHFLQKEVMRA